MKQPEHLLRSQTSPYAPRRAVSLGLVAAFHVVVIWAFVSGLANRIVEKLPVDIVTKVEPPKLPDKLPPPPPPPKLEQPPPPYVPPPDIVIQSEVPATNAITTQNKVASVPKAAGITAPALIMGGRANCAANYYPPIAIRLSQEGTVTLSVHIDAQGQVTAADVVNSSGHDSLDQAGVRCVTSAWHFKPAMQSGQPVAVTRQYAIRFVLQ